MTRMLSKPVMKLVNLLRRKPRTNPFVRGLRRHGLSASLAFGIPSALAAHEAPEGRRGRAIGETMKWTALAMLPGLAIMREPTKALTAAFGAGLVAALQLAGGYEAKKQSKKTQALIEALGKKIVPGQYRKIEREGGFSD